MPNVNSGPISLAEAPKPAVTLPVCSVVSPPAHPIDDIHTLSHTRGVASALRIFLRIGAVFGSSAMESNVETFTCLCMFDCPARMNTFSGLATAWLAISGIRARTAAIIIHFIFCPMFLLGQKLHLCQPQRSIGFAASCNSDRAGYRFR